MEFSSYFQNGVVVKPIAHDYITMELAELA